MFRRFARLASGVPFAVAAAAFVAAGVRGAEGPRHPEIVLSAHGVTVGAAPTMGGRITSVRLAADGAPDFLHRGDEGLDADLDANGALAPTTGHTFWLSPQHRWPRRPPPAPRQEEGSPVWPPDPHLDALPYAVLEHTATRLRMRGPDSPVSGVRMEKDLEILPDGTIRVAVRVINTGAAPVSWAVWSNTRFPAAARCYVPLDPRERLAFDVGLWGKARRGLMATRCELDWFSVVPERPAATDAAMIRGVKAYMALRAPRMAVSSADGRYWLEKRAGRLVAPTETAPGHAPAEIYQRMTRPDHDRSEDILEVEMQGVYQTLAPGASMEWEESWRLWSEAAAPESPEAYLEARLSGSSAPAKNGP